MDPTMKAQMDLCSAGQVDGGGKEEKNYDSIYTLSRVPLFHLSCYCQVRIRTLPMKYANYIHACVETQLVGKCHRVVY